MSAVSTLEPLPTSLAPTDLVPAALAAWPADGLGAPSIQPELACVGINRDGQFYLYGPSADQPGPVIDSLCGVLVTAVEITSRGEGSRYGERDYLTVRLATMTPTLAYLLRLPCHQDQWSVRSLLGALQEVDLCATPLKLEATKGRQATFITVSLDSAGLHRVKASAIEPGRHALEMTVNRLRTGLGQPPQFP